jgi:hypothetical protein
MSRASPKKSITKKNTSSPVREVFSSFSTTVVKHSYEYEFIDRLNKVEVENDRLRTQMVSIEEKNTVIMNLQQDKDQLERQLARSEEIRTLLTNENFALKNEVRVTLEEKKTLENELFKASEYILSLEEKCHAAHLTSLEVLKTLKAREYEI